MNKRMFFHTLLCGAAALLPAAARSERETLPPAAPNTPATPATPASFVDVHGWIVKPADKAAILADPSLQEVASMTTLGPRPSSDWGLRIRRCLQALQGGPSSS